MRSLTSLLATLGLLAPSLPAQAPIVPSNTAPSFAVGVGAAAGAAIGLLGGNVFYQGSASTLLRTPLPPNRVTVTPDTGTVPPTHWAEGAVIGGVGLGAAFAFLTYELCHDLNESASTNCTSEALGGALLGAAIGFVVGGLVGGAFPKDK